jgi:hypothetical protein
MQLGDVPYQTTCSLLTDSHVPLRKRIWQMKEYLPHLYPPDYRSNLFGRCRPGTETFTDSPDPPFRGWGTPVCLSLYIWLDLKIPNSEEEGQI